MTTELAAADFVKGFEGYVGTAMWDVDAYRIGHGSDTLTLPNGSYRKVVEHDTTTPELARQDLARRIRVEFIPRVQGQIGGVDAWNKLSQGCQVALIDFAYNYGSITKKAIRDAAMTGNSKAVGDAILSSTKNDNERLLHVGDNKKNPLKTGKALENAQKMRNALYARREKEAAMCGAETGDNSTVKTSDPSKRTGGYGLLGIIFTCLIVGALIWMFV